MSILPLLLLACASEPEHTRDPVVDETAPVAPVDTAPPETPYALPTGAVYSLTFIGEGYQPYEGKWMSLALYPLGGATEPVADASVLLDATGAVVVELTDAVVEGGRYLLYLYVDMNDDGRCDNPPVDHAWSTESAGTWGGAGVKIGPITTDTEVYLPLTVMYDFNGCDAF